MLAMKGGDKAVKGGVECTNGKLGGGGGPCYLFPLPLIGVLAQIALE